MDPRYPIGKYKHKSSLNDGERRGAIEAIADCPARLRAAVHGLTAVQLDTPYRDGGWTVRQVVHHVPDSHLNAYLRFKLGLTESEPTIKTYEESLWARLGDVRGTRPEVSLALLEALHERWVVLLRSLSAADFGRTLRHPDLGVMTLDDVLGLYAWHSRHHVAHITSLRDRMGWK